MRFFLFIILVFSIVLNQNAQVFAPDDAIWYYTYDPDITLDDGYRRIDYQGDTIINLHDCKILRTTDIGYSYWNKDYYEIIDDNIYIYEEDSIIYYLKSGEFYILYDFTAKKGDTITTISYPHNCDSTYQIIIDSIGYQNHYQDSLRKYYFHLFNDTKPYYYLEKIGYPDYLLPIFLEGCYSLTGPHYPGPLRCYQDSNIGNFSTGVSSSCDYILESIELSLKGKLNIFPNPTNRQLVIYVQDNQEFTYELMNQYGRLMDKSIFQSHVEIDLSEYPSGIYLIAVKSTQILVGTFKILRY